MEHRSTRHESPEQLIEVFKAAALSVTKLYKSSVAAEVRARADGYQDCLDDLFTFLERDAVTLGEAASTRLRKWAADRRDGRDPTSESEDEVIDKSESISPPDPLTNNLQISQAPAQTPSENPPPVEIIPPTNEPHQFIVPSQENFTFQSDHQYPNIATLDLSDTASHGMAHRPTRTSRNRNGNRSGIRPNHLGRGAGTKRRMDFDDLFGGCFGGKDPFSGGGKRSRHT